MSLQKVNTVNFKGVVGDTFGAKPIRLVKEEQDWSGASVSIEVKERPQSQAVITYVPSLSIDEQGDAQFSFQISAELTQHLSPVTYYYDIHVSFPSGEIRTPVRGQIDFGDYNHAEYQLNDENEFVIQFVESEGMTVEFLDAGNGKSAYEVWLTLEGNAGKTETEFIESLKYNAEWTTQDF